MTKTKRDDLLFAVETRCGVAADALRGLRQKGIEELPLSVVNATVEKVAADLESLSERAFEARAKVRVR